MKITVIGAGRVGGTLGKRFAQLGHQVSFLIRDKNSNKYQALREACGAHTTLYSAEEAKQATSESDVIVITLPWDQVESTLGKLAPLSGKIVIDATNPLEMSEQGLFKGLLVGHNTSGGEQVAQWLPQAKVSKGFNTIGWEVMQQPVIDGEATTLLVCGDPIANQVTMKLASELGFAPVEIGDIKLARLIEPMAMLWIHLRFALGWSPEFSFALKRAAAVVR